MAAMPSSPATATGPVVAFTTPPSYAPRLAHLILRRGWTPLTLPSVLVSSTPGTADALRPYFRRTPAGEPLLSSFSALAFTSRNGITAVSELLQAEPGSPPCLLSPELPFTVAALGKDAELLTPEFLSDLCSHPGRVRILVPQTATPAGMVESLGHGAGRRVLCPVPLVLGLKEPPVVPGFISSLTAGGWEPVRVPAYETRWAGPGCAAELLQAARGVDAIVFTSTAEVEGLLKGLKDLGLGWSDVRRRWPKMVVAAHGPVTAAGAAAAGVDVEVVGERFESFEGVVEALAVRLGA